MITKHIFWKGHRIFYNLTGNGSPVVLIHGFGEDGTIWNNQSAVLFQHHQLIIPDLPGSGRSDFIPNADIETYSDIIVELVKQESGSTPITLIGHSMGGYIALAFAEKNPSMLNGFGLVHSTAFADSEDKKQARLKSIDFIKNNGAAAFLETAIPGLFAPDFVQQHADQVMTLVEKGKHFTADSLVQYYEAMMSRPDRIEVLKNFDKPILFIIGGKDNAIPLESSLKQCHLPKQAHIDILPDCGQRV